jgi:hypothetical protein
MKFLIRVSRESKVLEKVRSLRCAFGLSNVVVSTSLPITNQKLVPPQFVCILIKLVGLSRVAGRSFLLCHELVSELEPGKSRFHWLGPDAPSWVVMPCLNGNSIPLSFSPINHDPISSDRARSSMKEMTSQIHGWRYVDDRLDVESSQERMSMEADVGQHEAGS